MLRFKPECRVGLFNAQLADMFTAASDWSVLHQVDVRVNSINDGAAVHIAGSLHGLDLAADFGVDSNTPGDRTSLGNYFRAHLPAGYDVILEQDHVHVEYDAHRPALAQGGGS